MLPTEVVVSEVQGKRDYIDGEVSRMEGIGIGVSGVLVLLQILQMIMGKRSV